MDKLHYPLLDSSVPSPEHRPEKSKATLNTCQPLCFFPSRQVRHDQIVVSSLMREGQIPSVILLVGTGFVDSHSPALHLLHEPSSQVIAIIVPAAIFRARFSRIERFAREGCAGTHFHKSSHQY